MGLSLADAIKAAATKYKMDEADTLDLATIMSYETAGTYDEWKAGPRTQHGQHRGLIQWGEPQAKQYGVYKGMPVEQQVDASLRYLQDRGWKPGAGRLAMYAAINAGHASKINASDANNGGAPGTVADKVRDQMADHEKKALALLGGDFSPAPMNPYEAPAPATSDPSVQPAAPSAAPINDINSVYDNHQTPYKPTLAEVIAQQADDPQAYQGWGEQLYDSGAQNWYPAKMVRWASQGAMDPHDTGWSPEEWESITQELPEHYHDYVMTGSSKDNRQLRLKYAHEMAERDARAAATGTGSTLVADLLTGMADPLLLPLVAGTGGTAIPGLAGRSFAAKVVGGALISGTENAALELGAKYGFEDPNTNALAAFGIGAILGGLTGPLARSAATRVEANMLSSTGMATVAQAKATVAQAKATVAQAKATVAQAKATASAGINPNLPVISSPGGSMGAAKNPEHIPAFDPKDWGIDDADVDRGFGGRLRLDVAGQLTTSENPRARMAGFSIFEEAAGTKDHAVLATPASVRAVALERRTMGNRNAVYQVALKEYVGEAASWLHPITRARKAEEFHTAVNAYMNESIPPADAHPAVIKAAGARKEFYQTFQREFEGAFGTPLGSAKNEFYSPKVADHTRIAALDRQVDEDTMHRFIEDAVRKAHGVIDDKLLKKIAKGYWANIRKAGYGMEDNLSMAINLGDKQAFLDGFKRSLAYSDIDDADLDEVFNIFTGLVDKAKKNDNSKGMARAKKRTVMDYAYKANVRTRTGEFVELKMDDLFIQDAEFLDHRYARTMSGRIAFAQTQIRDPKSGELIFDGIKSEADLDKLKKWVSEGYRQSGKPLAEVKGAMENAIENIDFGWRRINGIPVYGQETEFAQWVRRVKAAQFIRLMSNMGLNQIQEVWKVASMTGFRAAMSQLPAIRRMVTESGRSVPRRDELLKELEHMTGLGMDGLVGKFDFRLHDDRIGAQASSKIANTMDVALDWGQRATAEISLMRSIHDYQQKWAAKVVSQHLLNMARKASTAGGGFDLSRLGKGNKNRLATAGIGDEEATKIFGSLLKHSTRSGNKLLSLNAKDWDAGTVTLFSHTLNRYTDRLVQRNDVGGLAKWMSQPMLSLFVQFRSFVIGAWAKSTLYAVNHMDPRMAVMLVGELAFGTATYMVRQSHQMATEDGYDKYVDETLDPVNLAKNGWARTATASVLPMLMDSALMWTPVGAQFGSARASGAPQDALFGAPVSNQLEGAARFTKGVINSVADGRPMAQTEIKAGVGSLLPLANFMPFAALMSHLIEDRLETPPRN